jgi:hypothetical protein
MAFTYRGKTALKAFVLSFSSALAVECRGKGVHVVALCPGPSDTGFFAALNNVAIEQKAFLSRRARVADVVMVGLQALERRQTVAVVGCANRLLAVVTRLLPREWVALVTERMFHAPSGSAPTTAH